MAIVPEVGATTLTVNVCVAGVFVPSQAVTATVKLLPTVSVLGALSSKTPFCVSVKTVAETILIGLSRSPLLPETVSADVESASRAWRTVVAWPLTVIAWLTVWKPKSE